MLGFIYTGPSSIAVLGELRGIEMALEMFSNYSKSNITEREKKREALFADAIKYAEDGFPASKHLADAIQKAIVEEPTNSKDHSFMQHQSDPWFQELK